MPQQRPSHKLFWNWYAVCYDSITRLLPYQDMLKEIIRLLDLKPGERLLDAGCGTGNLEFALWQDFHKKYPQHPLRVDAVDFSESMLWRAIKKCETIHEIAFRWMDLNEPLPYPDGIFDKVVSINSLYALREPQNTVKEFSRLLKPEGKMIVIVPRNDFKMGDVAREQFRKVKEENPSFLSQILHHSRDMARLPAFAWVIACNLAIDGKARAGEFQTFTQDAFHALLNGNLIIRESKQVYANQFYLTHAERG